MPRLYGGMARVEIMGWSGLYGGMARLIWWDVQAVNMGWPGLYGGDGQGATWHVQGLMWTWSGQGYMVGWPGCNMTCPGFNVNMVRVQHGVARVINNALYRAWPWGGPLWLSIQYKRIQYISYPIYGIRPLVKCIHQSRYITYVYQVDLKNNTYQIIFYILFHIFTMYLYFRFSNVCIYNIKITHCYIAEIFMIRRKTLSNQSINQNQLTFWDL